VSIIAKYERVGLRFAMVGRVAYVFGPISKQARDAMVKEKHALVADIEANDLIARAQRSARVKIESMRGRTA
jgi:hypothetical protein